LINLLFAIDCYCIICLFVVLFIDFFFSTDRKVYISPANIKDYLKTNSSETPEKVRNLRVMLVGPDGVGKSLLCKQLMKESPISDDSDQHALEMYIKKYVVDLDTSELEVTPESEADIADRRISLHAAMQQSLDKSTDKDMNLASAKTGNDYMYIDIMKITLFYV